VTRFLVVLDVDSTLIQDEVIELLADAAGVREQVAAVTERAMRGELDFAASLRERVATLTDLPVTVFEDTLQRIRPTTGVHEFIAAVHAADGKVGAVSGGFSQVLDVLAKELNLDFHRANLLGIESGKLTGKVESEIVDARAKATALFEWAAQCNLSLAQTLAVGDGANDLEMMKIAGLSVAFNAKPVVRENAKLVIAKMICAN